MSIKLTTAQAVALAKVKKEGPKGLPNSATNASLLSLAKKGFVALLPGTRTKGARWVVTDEGNRF